MALYIGKNKTKQKQGNSLSSSHFMIKLLYPLEGFWTSILLSSFVMFYTANEYVCSHISYACIWGSHAASLSQSVERDGCYETGAPLTFLKSSHDEVSHAPEMPVCLVCLWSETGMTRSESIGEMNLFKIFSYLCRENLCNLWLCSISLLCVKTDLFHFIKTWIQLLY